DDGDDSAHPVVGLAEVAIAVEAINEQSQRPQLRAPAVQAGMVEHDRDFGVGESDSGGVDSIECLGHLSPGPDDQSLTVEVEDPLIERLGDRPAAWNPV